MPLILIRGIFGDRHLLNATDLSSGINPSDETCSRQAPRTSIAKPPTMMRIEISGFKGFLKVLDLT